MTIVFLVLLGLAWMSVILPAALRARQDAPLSTAERFKRRMALIAPATRSTGRWIVVPESPRDLARASFLRAQHRRARILVGLVVAVVLSALGALVIERGIWSLNLALDASLIAYVALLLEAKRRRDEVARKVRTLHRPAASQVRFWEPARAQGGRRD